MMKNIPTKNTVTVNLHVRDFLVNDVWEEFTNCARGYDDDLFEMLFKKTWNSYGSTLHNKGLTDYQNGYQEVVRVVIKEMFTNQEKTGTIENGVARVTQDILDRENLKKHWTDTDIDRIRKSFKCSRADAIDMLNGAYHNEMANIFATAAADDY